MRCGWTTSTSGSGSGTHSGTRARGYAGAEVRTCGGGSASLRAGERSVSGARSTGIDADRCGFPEHARRLRGTGPTRDQKAKTAFPLRVAAITQVLEKVYFQATRLPFHTPSAVTVTGA